MASRHDLAPDLDRLRLLASAFADRPLDVAAGVPGDLPWTDGSTVFIDAAAPGRRQVQMVGVQASLLAAGSLAPHLLRQLSRRPALAQRYLAVEAHRALACNESVLPPFVRRLVNNDSVAGIDTPDAALALARGKQMIPAPSPLFGTIRARRLLSARGANDAVRSAAEAGPAARNTNRSADLLALTDNEDDDQIGDLFSSPVGGGGAVGRLFTRLLRPARSRSGGGPPGADAPTHMTDGPPRTGRRATLSNAAPTFEVAPEIARPGTAYPEWDIHRGQYRFDWCTVIDSDPPERADAAVEMPNGAALRRPLARLAIGINRCRHQSQGDDVDVDAAVQAQVDAVAGSPHDDDVYIGSLRRQRGLAALVLLDVSGSAGEPGVSGRSVHDQQLAVAAGLTAALHDLGDRVALYGFNSRGRQAVQVMRVKAFDDRLDRDMAQRLAALVPAAYTRLGAAIRHGATILDERGGTPRRLLIVISDGFAYDHNYEGRYAEGDARRALVEARRRGIGCLCLSVGTDIDPAALRRVFGTAAHASVPRAELLPTFIGPLFRTALRSVEAQRRVFERNERTRERLWLEGRFDGSRRAPLLRSGR